MKFTSYLCHLRRVYQNNQKENNTEAINNEQNLGEKRVEVGFYK